MTWNYEYGGKTWKVTDRWNPANPVDVRNIQAEIKALDGKTPLEVFGEEVPLGEIHFTDWSPDTCGCTHRYLARHDGKGIEVAHKGLKYCEAHKDHHDNHAAHYSAILKENRHKNEQVIAHAKSHQIDHEEISFCYDDLRQLVISHPAFGTKTIAQPKVN